MYSLYFRFLKKKISFSKHAGLSFTFLPANIYNHFKIFLLVVVYIENYFQNLLHYDRK